MFKKAISYFKKRYYRKLFLKIYFGHLNNPKIDRPDNALGYATYDFQYIKGLFSDDIPNAQE
jgi:hypothetical protein